MPEWTELVARAIVPHFLSAAWVGIWLDVYGGQVSPDLFTWREGDRLLASCLLTRRRERRGPIPIQCLYVNSAGQSAGEAVSIEYNEVPCRPGHEEGAARELRRAILAQGADEVVFEGGTRAGIDLLRRALPDWSERTEWSEDPWVDLRRIRSEGGAYRKSALSRNTRRQVTQTLTAYAKLGEVEVEIASDAGRALELLDELVVLHQGTWRRRGSAGAFASPRSLAFHRELISRTFPVGTPHLLRIAAGGTTIGILYNFVDANRVFFYQSGLRYGTDNRHRPGLATHVAAIERYLASGYSEYHFLAGDVPTPRYKRSLSTDTTVLGWSRWQRPGLKSLAIERLRRVKWALVGGG